MLAITFYFIFFHFLNFFLFFEDTQMFPRCVPFLSSGDTAQAILYTDSHIMSFPVDAN